VPTAPEHPANVAPATRFIPPNAPLLGDDAGTQFQDRALIRGRQQCAVVAREPGRARLLVDASDYRVLSWVDEPELVETVLTVTELVSGPHSEDSTAIVAPGVALTRKSTRGDWLSVEATDDTVRTWGWLSADRVGRVFRLIPLPPAPERKCNLLCVGYEIRSNTKIAKAPGGKTIALTGDEVAATRELATRGWFRKVEYESSLLRVSGWIPKTAMLGNEPRGIALGTLRPVPEPPYERVELPVGTCLYDHPAGEVVGYVRRPMKLDVHVGDAEWRAFQPDHGLPEVWVNLKKDPEPSTSSPLTCPIID